MYMIETMANKENVITKTQDIIRWFLPKAEKFPRAYKFTLGDRLINHLFDLVELLIEAYYTKDKFQYLRSANINLEKIRFLFRLSEEMRFLSRRQYEFVSKEIDEVGRSLGGWIKQQELKQ